MQFKHAPAAVSAMFDDPNLVSAAGLVPMLRLARSAGLDELAQSRLSVPTDKGANAGGKVMALVAGMLAGADSIDDMNVLRHGGMGRLFDRTYAPSTLGSFLREFRFGHVRQLDAVASRTLVNLASAAPLLQISFKAEASTILKLASSPLVGSSSSRISGFVSSTFASAARKPRRGPTNASASNPALRNRLARE